MRRAALSLVVALVLVGGCLSSGGARKPTVPTTLPATTETAPTTAATTTTVLVAPTPPSLKWQACGSYECATLQVPLDYSKPAGRQIGIALNRKRATSPSQRVGSLLVNPGGPGVSGVEALPDLLMRLSSKVKARFDVVGFDPRGVGLSAPVRCLPNAELAASFAIDPTPDNEAEKVSLVQSTESFVAGCQKLSGDLLPHVGTQDAARDMDLIRAGVGDEKLTYVGFSYGTTLGTAYAELFPGRVRALILDGAVDPALDTMALGQAQGEGFDKAFDAFVADCRSRRACAWKPAGGPSKAAFLALSARVDGHPVAAGSRHLGPGEFFLGVAAFLYQSQAWPQLAQGLADIEVGRAAIVLAGFDRLAGRKPDGSFSNDQEAGAAINCLDRAAPRDIAAYEQAASAAALTAPAFGPAIAWSGLVCGLWPIPATGMARPAHAPGSPPILVVGTTNDPATPFVWAEALAGQLPQGRLLRHQGEGHTAYGEDLCTTDIGDAYLLTLKLPPAPLNC